MKTNHWLPVCNFGEALRLGLVAIMVMVSSTASLGQIIDGDTPIRKIPGLVAVILYERTGGDSPTPLIFPITDSRLTERVGGKLTYGRCDFSGAGLEFYDVFLSDPDGSPNPDGSFVTVEAEFPNPDEKAGGGLNIADIALGFGKGNTQYATWVSSFVALGKNAISDSARFAVDGNLQTHTTMGNTFRQNRRLRITVGFEGRVVL